MNSISQEAKFRQRVVKYSFKKNVTEAATASVEPTTPASNPETPTTGDEGTQNPTE